MTGDGVNDALALKDADIGIAMGSGAPATRAVAQVVLLDGRFANMPSVVAEGRRVIANVERVANLFVTKTFYAMMLAIAIGVARWPYPFLPRHLTIVSSLTIGIPAFFLALAPNPRRYVPGFVRRVLFIAGPAGVVAAAATFSAFAIARHYDDLAVSRTAATITVLLVGLWVLNLLARPITPPRALVFGAMVGAFVVILGVPALRDWFALDLPSGPSMWAAGAAAGGGIAVLEAGWQVRQWRTPPDQRTPRWAWRRGRVRSSVIVRRARLKPERPTGPRARAVVRHAVRGRFVPPRLESDGQQCSVPESGRAIGSTGGVVDEVCGEPALDGCPKSSVRHMDPFAEQKTPTPTRVKPGARMFWRCPSECIHASWSEPASRARRFRPRCSHPRSCRDRAGCRSSCAGSRAPPCRRSRRWRSSRGWDPTSSAVGDVSNVRR